MLISFWLWIIGFWIGSFFTQSELAGILWFFAGWPTCLFIVLFLMIWFDIDDHNSNWGGAGPDCSTMQREAAF
jgi:hypothetical protein